MGKVLVPHAMWVGLRLASSCKVILCLSRLVRPQTTSFRSKVQVADTSGGGGCPLWPLWIQLQCTLLTSEYRQMQCIVICYAQSSLDTEAKLKQVNDTGSVCVCKVYLSLFYSNTRHWREKYKNCPTQFSSIQSDSSISLSNLKYRLAE